jgi:hypothetical protein
MGKVVCPASAVALGSEAWGCSWVECTTCKSGFYIIDPAMYPHMAGR